MTTPPKPITPACPCGCKPDELSEARRQKLLETLQRNLISANKIAEELARMEAERKAA